MLAADYDEAKTTNNRSSWPSIMGQAYQQTVILIELLNAILKLVRLQALDMCKYSQRVVSILQTIGSQLKELPIQRDFKRETL